MTKNHAKAKAQQLGDRGEDVVAALYQRAGFDVVARNWRCFEGELDIVATRGRLIVVCEVKTRRSRRHMDPTLSITPAKQAKVRTAGYRWRNEHGALGRMRFDVAIVVDEQVQLIEAAF